MDATLVCIFQSIHTKEKYAVQLFEYSIYAVGHAWIDILLINISFYWKRLCNLSSQKVKYHLISGIRFRTILSRWIDEIQVNTKQY